MPEYGTIKIPRAEYDRHNERREEMNLTWSEYIDGEAPDTPDAIDPDELAEQITSDLLARLPPKIADELRG